MDRHHLRQVAELVVGRSRDQTFWSERWLSSERVLSQCTAALASAGTVDAVTVDDGWTPDVDISVAATNWAALDVRVLVEEHSLGRCLLRVGTRLRLSRVAIAVSVLACLLPITALAVWNPPQWPGSLSALVAVSVAGALFAFWRLARAVGEIDRVLASVLTTLGTTVVPARAGEKSRPLTPGVPPREASVPR